MKVQAFSVATGRYADYWATMAATADRWLFPENDLHLTVFSDRVVDLRAVATRFERAYVEVVPTTDLGWPWATLMRYHLVGMQLRTSTADIVVHIDADMHVVSRVEPVWGRRPSEPPMFFVQHPGFGASDTSWRRSARALVEGGPGTWEKRSAYQAYTPRHLRRRYVCGGFWLGFRAPVEAMCAELAMATNRDLQAGRIARWHDESYLNRFYAMVGGTLLDESYCWDESRTPWPHGTKIIAVDKGAERTRLEEP